MLKGLSPNKNWVATFQRLKQRDRVGDLRRNSTSENEHKSLINRSFIPLLIGWSLVRDQVEKPKFKSLNAMCVQAFFVGGLPFGGDVHGPPAHVDFSQPTRGKPTSPLTPCKSQPLHSPGWMPTNPFRPWKPRGRKATRRRACWRRVAGWMYRP